MAQSSSHKQNKFREACTQFDTLKAEWDRPPQSRNIDKCVQILSSLKIILTEISFIPTSGEATDQECLLARSALEIACFLSIETRDLDAYERYMAELKTYYLDLGGGLAESPFCPQLLGLDLLCLLAQNRLADFHAALELIPHAMLPSPYIRHPIQMEQFLMEGSYNKIFIARESVPAAACTFFMDLLIGTVRKEIASCLEQAYEHLTVQDGARLLFFTNQKELKEFVEKLGWRVDTPSGTLAFPKKKSGQPTRTRRATAAGDPEAFASDEIGKNLLSYARGLETII